MTLSSCHSTDAKAYRRQYWYRSFRRNGIRSQQWWPRWRSYRLDPYGRYANQHYPGTCHVYFGRAILNLNAQALGEMSIIYPVSGGFYTLAIRFIDPSFAFAMGWNYVFQWMVTLPLEITVAVTTVQYWTDDVPVAAWVTIFYVVICAQPFRCVVCVQRPDNSLIVQ